MSLITNEDNYPDMGSNREVIAAFKNEIVLLHKKQRVFNNTVLVGVLAVLCFFGWVSYMNHIASIYIKSVVDEQYEDINIALAETQMKLAGIEEAVVKNAVGLDGRFQLVSKEELEAIKIELEVQEKRLAALSKKK